MALTQPIVLGPVPVGQVISATAKGSLGLRGVSREMTFNVAGRYDGTTLEVAGSGSFRASDWGVAAPFGIHDDDTVEFLVVLHRS